MEVVGKLSLFFEQLSFCKNSGINETNRDYFDFRDFVGETAWINFGKCLKTIAFIDFLGNCSGYFAEY